MSLGSLAFGYGWALHWGRAPIGAPPRPVVVLLGVVAAAEELEGVAVVLPLSFEQPSFWMWLYKLSPSLLIPGQYIKCIIRHNNFYFCHWESIDNICKPSGSVNIAEGDVNMVAEFFFLVAVDHQPDCRRGHQASHDPQAQLDPAPGGQNVH